MKTIRITLTAVVSDDTAEEMKNEILSGKMQREAVDANNCKSAKITYEEIREGRNKHVRSNPI